MKPEEIIKEIDQCLSEEETLSAELHKEVEHNNHIDYAYREFQAMCWWLVSNGEMTAWEAEENIDFFEEWAFDRSLTPTL